MPCSKKWRERVKKYSLAALLLLFFAYIFIDSLASPLPKKEGDVCFYFQELGDDLKYILSFALREAKTSLHLSSFSFYDRDIAALLAEKEGEGVAIELAFDPKQNHILPKHHHFLFKPHPYKGLMHRKLAAIDASCLLFGSTNFTSTSLKLHHNLLIAIRSPPLFQAIASETPYQNGGLTFLPLPEKGDLALSLLINAIHQAKKRIYVAIYTFTHPQIATSLIEAKERGVDVRIFTDRGMAKHTSKKVLTELGQKGIPIYLHRGSGLFHHKSAWIDDSFVCGSANWTKAAFKKNRELFFFFERLPPHIAKKVATFFSHIERVGQGLDNLVEGKYVKNSSRNHLLFVLADGPDWERPYLLAPSQENLPAAAPFDHLPRGLHCPSSHFALCPFWE